MKLIAVSVLCDPVGHVCFVMCAYSAC